MRTLSSTDVPVLLLYQPNIIGKYNLHLQCNRGVLLDILQNRQVLVLFVLKQTIDIKQINSILKYTGKTTYDTIAQYLGFLPSLLEGCRQALLGKMHSMTWKNEVLTLAIWCIVVDDG